MKLQLYARMLEQNKLEELAAALEARRAAAAGELGLLVCTLWTRMHGRQSRVNAALPDTTMSSSKAHREIQL